jgi:hypothetical protein
LGAYILIFDLEKSIIANGEGDIISMLGHGAVRAGEGCSGNKSRSSPRCSRAKAASACLMIFCDIHPDPQDINPPENL